MKTFVVRLLAADDRPAIMNLAATDHLRPEGILEPGTQYWGAFEGDRLIGFIGCEYEGKWGLLRSALVDNAYRGMGVAASLTGALLKDAMRLGLEAVYLFSTDAGAYWMHLGFKLSAVDEVVSRLHHTPQVKLFEKLDWLPTEVAYKMDLTEAQDAIRAMLCHQSQGPTVHR